MGRLKNLIRNVNYLSKHSLWEQREEDIVYLTNKILSDGIYEYGIDVPGEKRLNILTRSESQELILNNPDRSFVRTGDGEVKMMMGMDQPFQRYEPEIARRLIELLKAEQENIYVGLNRNYYVPLSNQSSYYYRRNAYDFRTFYAQHCNTKMRYIDATVTTCQIGGGRNSYVDAYMERWREHFRNRDIVVVCGKGILDGMKYDVFEYAGSKKVLDAPKRHAWDEHDSIISRIEREVSKEQVLVFILGMGGKAMIPELVDKGYVCWDVGHMAKYYNSYMLETPVTKESIANFYAPD